jgi:hypothetical protein
MEDNHHGQGADEALWLLCSAADFTKAFHLGELAKEHGNEMIPAFEPF